MTIATVVVEAVNRDEPDAMYRAVDGFVLVETANGILVGRNELIPWHRVRVVYYE
jgi:hypothetical protein